MPPRQRERKSLMLPFCRMVYHHTGAELTNQPSPNLTLDALQAGPSRNGQSLLIPMFDKLRNLDSTFLPTAFQRTRTWKTTAAGLSTLCRSAARVAATSASKITQQAVRRRDGAPAIFACGRTSAPSQSLCVLLSLSKSTRSGRSNNRADPLVASLAHDTRS